jgi:hypothetical protein
LLLQQSAFTEVEEKHEQRYEAAAKERKKERSRTKERISVIHNND